MIYNTSNNKNNYNNIYIYICGLEFVYPPSSSSSSVLEVLPSSRFNHQFIIHHSLSTPSAIHIHQTTILTSHHRFMESSSKPSSSHRVKVVKGYDYRPIRRHPPGNFLSPQTPEIHENQCKSMKIH